MQSKIRESSSIMTFAEDGQESSEDQTNNWN